MSAIAIPAFNILKFPLGGAQQELDRTLKAFSGAFRRPFQSVFVAGDAAASVLASAPWVAQWKFNGNGNDSIGTNHLTNNNSATFTTGKLGGATGATQLVAASNQYWSIVDNAALSMGDLDFTICAWVYLDSKNSSGNAFVSKDDATTNREYDLVYESLANRFRITIWGGSGGANRHDVYANNLGAVSLSTWYCVIAWHDSIADTINIQVNDGVVDSLTHAAGCWNGLANIRVGDLSGIGAWNHNGRIDNVCIAKSAAGGGGVLTAAQRSAFYAAGVGTENITT